MSIIFTMKKDLQCIEKEKQAVDSGGTSSQLKQRRSSPTNELLFPKKWPSECSQN